MKERSLQGSDTPGHIDEIYLTYDNGHGKGDAEVTKCEKKIIQLNFYNSN